MSDTILETKELDKRYKRVMALRNVSLNLAKGKVTVLLGPNGAGKTTLIRLAMGTLKPEYGKIRLFGLNPLKKPRQVRQKIGYVPTIPDAYDWMTLTALFKFLRPQYPTWDDEYALKAIEQLSIPTKTTFKNMSRGQGMKAMLVTALAPKPPLLLLDEPFAGLDPLAREEVLRGVIGQIREEGRTVLCATHDLQVASRLADRLIVLANGKLKTEGTVEEVLGCKEPTKVPDRILEMLREVATEAEVMV